MDSVKSALQRNIIWRSFYDMVRDGVIPSSDYINMMIKYVEKEGILFKCQMKLH